MTGEEDSNREYPYAKVLNLIAKFEEKGRMPPPPLIYAVYTSALQNGHDGVGELYAALLYAYPDLLKYFEAIPHPREYYLNEDEDDWTSIPSPPKTSIEHMYR